jgi:hypothetical protein
VEEVPLETRSRSRRHGDERNPVGAASSSTPVPKAAAQSVYWQQFAGPVFRNIKGFAFFPIPEPSTALLLALGLVGLAAGRRRFAE